jgi:membrane-bound lytic murein transglycosylase D
MAYLATDGVGHGALLTAVQRSGQHRDEVDRILTAWKVPTSLAAVLFVESGYDATATSLDGGVGMWSLSQEVAHAYGLAMLDTYDERRAIALSTEAAAHHLADLHERFGGWELALLAFGIGYGPVLDELEKHSSTDYWDIASEIPPEASGYVARVLALATMLGNRDRFGLDLAKPDDPQVTSDLEVPAGASFSVVARAAGTSVEKLRALNPEYLGNVVPDTGFAMVMHLPSAGLARAKELLMSLMYKTTNDGVGRADPRFDYGRGAAPDAGAGDGGARANAKESPSTVVVPHTGDKRMFYRVQDGDTLDSLARRFGVPRETVARDNALDPSAGLRPGQLLLLRPGTSPPADSP